MMGQTAPMTKRTLYYPELPTDLAFFTHTPGVVEETSASRPGPTGLTYTQPSLIVYGGLGCVLHKDAISKIASITLYAAH